MRDETRRKLERQLWLDRLKWIGAGLGLAALAGVGLWVTGLDATVETHHVPGVVATVGPLVGTTTKAIEEGLAVDVKLDDGRLVHVMALKKTDPHVGDHVEVAEHVHGTGRVTYTWK
ncbi:hypothetical protein [Hyphomicrobium sp.]|uniref:hypothetical protein n=1 Tax=Hyphomicrobium sp. TaxID=82 RepID=UPI002E36E73C|nr:hypothetical protein [Hyphomicrobium sp.]HEX2839837.1 hypothetical protein [Hyphomicrobium sp.]